MTQDPLLLPLAQEALACYDPSVVYAWEGENKTSHVIHRQVNNVHTFTFAGTMPSAEEWLLDFSAVPVPIPDIPEIGDIHAGFAIGACTAVYEYILPTLASLGNPKFYLAGHSKGAGQAGQAYGILKAHGRVALATRMYEAPFFGGQMLASMMTDADIEWTESYNDHRADIVCQVPFGSFWKRHKPPVKLKVSNDADFIQMHSMKSIVAAIQTL